jgi:phosphoglycerate dehydrogenase-like enzyme
LIIINTSRGPVIKEDDLIKALKYGIIGDVGLDVYEEEPLYDKELIKFKNVILSPHNANTSPLYYKKVHERCIKETINSDNNNVS